MRVLLLDNYDSYTWILAHLLEDLSGREIQVLANNAVDLPGLRRLAFDCIVISPGPGTPQNPDDFGVCAEVFDAFPEVPILGVCLGHQGLALAAGGGVRHAPRPVHGRADPILHDGTGIFEGLPSPFKATRYHSLVVDPVPPSLRVNARTPDGLVMGLAHRSRPHAGVQFHPESIATEYGREMLGNFLRMAGPLNARRRPARQSSSPTPPSAELLPWRSPESTFLELFSGNAFWLDDATARGWSVMGRPRAILRSQADGLWREEGGRNSPYSASLMEGLRRALAGFSEENLPFGPGLYGWAGYELRRHFGLPCQHPAQGLPEGLWMEVEDLLVFDPPNQQVWMYGSPAFRADVKDAWERPTVPPPAPAAPLLSNLRLSRENEGYLSDIQEIFRALLDGDTYEACLSLQAEADPLDSLPYYRWLRQRSPAAYGAFFRVPEGAVASVSPELLLSLQSDRRLRTEPIKGTRPRGADPSVALHELETSEKDRAELLMITDLLRNDLARVAAPGTVEVPEARRFTVHPTVVHTSARIEADLREGMDAVDALAAVFPGGSITGAPKYRSVAILESLERRPRGVYTGAIGYLGPSSAHLSVAIRTAELTPQGTRVGAGGAIVVDSLPQSEWEEVLLKLRVMLPDSATDRLG